MGLFGFGKNKYKRILKAIAKQQATSGIAEGDLCPCCGKPVMNGDDTDVVMDDSGVSICQSCYMEIALSGNDICYDRWAAVTGEYQDSVQEQELRMTTDMTVVPRFAVGDRVYDLYGDWPATILQPIEDGLYVARLDGHEEESVLKDAEIVTELDDDLPSYVAFLKERFEVGCSIKILSISSIPGDGHQGQKAQIAAVTDDGGIVLDLEDSSSLVIYPDVDIFQRLELTNQEPES